MTRLIALDELSAGELSQWRELAAQAVEPNPFYEPDVVLAAHAHLRPAGAALLVAEDAEGWSACLPVRRPGRGPVTALRSWLHLYAFLGMPLVRREQPLDALRGLLRGALRASSSGLLVLDALPTDGPAGALVDAALAAEGITRIVGQDHARATLLRRPDGGYLDHLGSHHQREANRLGRRLGDALGGEPVVVDRSDDPEAVERFLRLERTGWKGSEGTAMACRPGDAAFFRVLCERFRAAGRLQLLALEVGEHTAAMKCNLAAGDALFCFKIAQDDELNKFSPGIRLERANVERFHEQRGERWMDSCAAADNKMINRLWPDRRRVGTFVLGRRDLRTGIPALGVRAAFRLRERASSRPVPAAL